MSDDILKKELDELRKLVDKHEDRIKDSSSAKPIDKGIFLKYDPFEEQNGLKILGEIEPDDTYPDGAVCSWKSWRFREDYGMRGWEAFKMGDKYTGENGELLSRYTNSPPMHMTGQAALDGYVRRGDLIFCRIDKRIKEARTHNKVMKTRIALQNVSLSDVETVRQGSATATIDGEGAQIEARPKGGFRVEKTQPPVAGAALSGEVGARGVNPKLLRTQLLPENREPNTEE